MTGTEPRLRGGDMIAAFKRAKIEFVVALPDITTSAGVMFPIAADPSLRLVRVCKEDEAIAIAMGLATCDRRAIVLIQQTGFLDSINAIRVLAVEYQQPIVMVVGLQGKEPGVKPRESKKFAVNIVEPMLDVMGIAHHLLETQGDHAVIAPAIETAYRNSTPVCLMVGQPPVAS